MRNKQQIYWGDFIDRGTATIPGWVKMIDDQAFSGCRDLKDVEIEDGVESIGIEAFRECTELTSIHIPASVRSIGIGAFSDCRNLKRISIDDFNPTYKSESGCCLTKDGKEVVFGCRYSKIPEGVITIRDGAFFCTPGSSVVLPSSIKRIGNRAFAYNTICTYLKLPEALESIGEMAFYNWDELKRIEIPASVRSIGQEAFESCKSLEEILIPDTVASIGDDAFRDCPIHNIILTNSVNKYAGGPLTNIKTCLVRVHRNCYQAVLHVPEGTEAGYRSDSFFKHFKNIVPW